MDYFTSLPPWITIISCQGASTWQANWAWLLVYSGHKGAIKCDEN